MQVRIVLRRDVGTPGPRDGPWIRARQVAKRLGPEVPGEMVEVVDAKDRLVGWGLFSPASTIVVRLVAFAGAPAPAEGWLEASLQSALSAREVLNFRTGGTTGYREVNSEGDRLPGLVVDRYGDDRVVLVTTAAMATHQDRIVDWLRLRTPGRLFVHTPASAVAREGFAPRPVVPSSPELAIAPLVFTENNVQIHANPPPGQKTGAFLDQRDNHVRIAELASRIGGPVLDIGCHHGGFALHAASRGCHAVGVDLSPKALEFAQTNFAVNQLGDRGRLVVGNLFHPRSWRDELGQLPPAFRGPFAAVVVDPPAVAKAKRYVGKASQALAQAVTSLLGQVVEGGLLVLCSCSHHLDRDHLDRVVQEAVGGSGWPRILALGPGPDHPVMPGHREGDYLRVNVYQRRA